MSRFRPEKTRPRVWHRGQNCGPLPRASFGGGFAVGGAAMLAADATVVTVRSDAGEHPAGAGRPGRLVVVAMPRDTATRVAAVSLGQPVTVTLR